MVSLLPANSRTHYLESAVTRYSSVPLPVEAARYGARPVPLPLKRRLLPGEADRSQASSSGSPRPPVARDASEALALSTPGRVAIMGGPGSGKSTALRQLFFQAAKRARHDSRAPLPIWVSLPALAYSQKTLEAYLTEGTPTFIQNAVARGRSVLCLDGLEALAAQDRLIVLEEVAHLASTWHGGWAITVDARDCQAEALATAGFALWELSPLDGSQRAALIQSQLAAIARLPQMPAEPSRTAELFRQQLAEHPRADWQANPSALALAAIAFARSGRVPPTQTELAEHALAAALAAVEPESQRQAQLRSAICELAFGLLRHAATTFAPPDLTRCARDLDWSESQAATVVERMVSAGLLDALARDIYRFRQPLLLGYLAAQALAARCGSDDASVREEAWELAWSHRLSRHWTHTLKLLPGILARTHGATGARVALRWLLALSSQRSAPDGDPANRGLALAVVTLPEVADVASFWGDTSAAGLTSQIAVAWADTLLDAASHGRETSLDELAPTVALLPERVMAPATERLLAALQAEDWQVRAAALRALAALGEHAPLDALLEALKDAEWRVRLAAVESLRAFATRVPPDALLPLLGDRWISRAAARTLAAMGERAPLEQLSATLHDTEPYARAGAAHALGLLGAVNALDALVEALGDEDDGARAAAAEALAQPALHVPVERIAALLRNHATPLRIRVAAAGVLGMLPGAKPVERLTRALKDREWPVRAAAAAALRTAGTRMPVKPLLAALRDGEWPVRLAALRTLATLGAQLPVEPVLSLLRDPEPRVRAEAARALGRPGSRPAFDALIVALRDEDERVRASAILALGAFGEQSVEPLLAARDDPSPLARRAIVRALGLAGGPAAIEPIVTSLHAGDEGMRTAALEALAELAERVPDEQVVAALRQADTWPETRAAAAQALGALGEHAPVARLTRLLSAHEEWQVRAAAVRALGMPGVPAPISPLVAALRDTSPVVRIAAVEVLGAQGVRAPVQALMHALRDRDPHVRAAAAHALGPLGAWTPVEALLEAIRDPDWQVRATATEKLGRLGTQAPTEVLVEALADDAWQVRAAAVEALRQQGSLAPAEALVRMLNDPDTVVRAHAVRALGVLGPSAPMNALRTAMADNDARVRAAAAYALGALGQQELLQTLTEDTDAGVRHAAGRALEGLDDEGEADQSRGFVPRPRNATGTKTFDGQDLASVLIGLLSDRDLQVRVAAVGALGMLGEQTPVDVLTRVLQDGANDPMDQVRVEAVRALGALGDRAPLTVLVEAVRDPAWAVRRAALESLRALGPNVPLGPIVAALHDSDADVRAAAARALGARTERAPIHELIAALRDPEWRVRAAAAEALEVLGPPEAIEPLVAMLDDQRNDPFGYASAAATRALGSLDAWDVVESLLDMRGEWAWRVRAAAVEVLALRGDETPIQRILTALKDPSSMVRAAAATALGALGDESLAAPLVAALDDAEPEVRMAAVRSLSLQGPRAPVDALLGALGDEHTGVRIVAIEALGILGHLVPPGRLVAMLGDSDEGVRRVAARVLRRVQPEALLALEPEATAILDRHHSGRVLGSLTQGFLAETLGQMGRVPHSLVALLCDLLDWPYWEVRLKAACALRRLGCELPDAAVRRLLELRRDRESRAVREAAEEALAGFLTLDAGLEE